MLEVNSLGRQLKRVLGWHQARITLLAQFIIALIKVRSVNLSVVAQAFSGPALTSSYYKRLQRFLRGFTPDLDQCAQVIAALFCPQGTWVLCLDRTNWDFGVFKINFLVLSVAHEGVGIPLLWMLLPKKGNSNTTERQQMMERFVRLFGVQKIQYFTADR